MLKGQVALVTGASRGIGRGIALQLGEAQATVYVTGREPKQSESQDGTLPTLEKTAREISERGGKGVAVFCDHSSAEDIKSLFERIQKETNGQLDILVNNAYSAVNAIIEASGKKFYELDPGFWDIVNNVGLRNHYICSVYAARMMVPKKQGLIVTVSSGGGLQYLFNTAYGVGKAACDRLAADMGHELRKDGVTSVSLWPGAVRTELIMKNIGDRQSGTVQQNRGDIASMKGVFEEGETIEYAGKSIVHLANDPNRLKKTGRILMTADLGDEYGFTDIDGRKPPNMRSVSTALKLARWDGLASWVPAWVKLPGWVLSAGTSKL